MRKKTAVQTTERRADSHPQQSGLIAKGKTPSDQRRRSPPLTIALIERTGAWLQPWHRPSQSTESSLPLGVRATHLLVQSVGRFLEEFPHVVRRIRKVPRLDVDCLIPLRTI